MYAHTYTIGQVHLLVYYIKLKSRLSDRHANISAVYALIETRLAQNESCVFWDRQVYFLKSTRAITHPHECVKGTGVS